jgi:hypothetical protein
MPRTAFLSCKESTDKTLPIGFLCEYISNPLVSVAQHIRLEWKTDCAQVEFRQSAYHVIVGIYSAHIWNGEEVADQRYFLNVN